MKDSSSEFTNFDRAMHKLIKVSHEEIKAKLDAEKAERADRDTNKASGKNKPRKERLGDH